MSIADRGKELTSDGGSSPLHCLVLISNSPIVFSIHSNMPSLTLLSHPGWTRYSAAGISALITADHSHCVARGEGETSHSRSVVVPSSVISQLTVNRIGSFRLGPEGKIG